MNRDFILQDSSRGQYINTTHTAPATFKASIFRLNYKMILNYEVTLNGIYKNN